MISCWNISMMVMRMIDKRWYVYQHLDPETHEIVYVGHGTLGRAWDVSRNRNQHIDHQDWMYGLTSKGYIPSDWARILQANLTKEEARELEKEYLQSRTYRFNRQRGQMNYQAKITDAEARAIFLSCKCKEGTQQEIAEKYGVSRSCVAMIASRKQWRAVTACLVE